MKKSQKIVCCAMIAAVLGAGVVVAAAAQSANGSAEHYVSDTIGEPLLSDSEISEPEVAAPAVSYSTVEDTEEEQTAIPEESESAPEDKTEEAAQPEEVKRYLPTANAPEDIDYCSVDDFVQTDFWGGNVVINTEMRSEVYAVSGGEVIFADYDLGNKIIIKYENGLYGMYDHLDFDGGMLVEKGDIVEAGQLIGMTGISGVTSEPCLSYVCRSELSPSFLARYPEMAEF